VKAPAKLAAYALVLAAAFGGGAAVGTAVGPIDGGSTGDDHGGHPTDTPAEDMGPTGAEDGGRQRPGEPGHGGGGH